MIHPIVSFHDGCLRLCKLHKHLFIPTDWSQSPEHLEQRWSYSPDTGKPHQPPLIWILGELEHKLGCMSTASDTWMYQSPNHDGHQCQRPSNVLRQHREAALHRDHHSFQPKSPTDPEQSLPKPYHVSAGTIDEIHC